MAGALGWTLLAALGYVVGGSLIWFKKEWSHRGLSVLVAISTGLLLSVAVGGMIPHGLSESPTMAFWILIGMLVAFGFQRWQAHRASKPENKKGSHMSAIWSVLTGMGIHAYFEGVAIGAGFHAGPEFGMTVLLAILLHKIPEGAAISTLVMAELKERKKAIASALILGFSTVLGAGTTLWLVKASWMHDQLSPISLLFSAGILLYIAGTELWPLLNQTGNRQSIISFLSSVLAYFLLAWAGTFIAPDHHHSSQDVQAAKNHPSSSADSHQHHHAVQPVVIPNGTVPPAVSLQVKKDSESGWNIHIQTKHFRFAPEHLNEPTRMGEGHAHLYVNGKKAARLYSPWYHLQELAPGTHEIRVELNSNQHAPFVYQGKKIEASATIVTNK
ncbi:ZIP family metal transporter [Paenactinomyces guangxiensis]|uniref:ZIP family metal transporter n=1 Tax=Paenactinomyces guangxiensis TaxID=1490290 RepID=A0A7W1WSS8_9BACL|nr:ZIP family metal transporter [Paenactinomyces guangxiensis]MBA4495381.1 ZIP family metal transporter [Paenactinomyces guangxiensis]MBH8592498.1 ZIP family metal transporter [Paenactinomyces guangxiensis]